LSRDATEARALPGVAGIFFAEDVPGENQIGAVVHDEPLFAVDEVHTEGQVVALVVADSLASCRAAAAKLQIAYEPLPAILTTRDAVARGAFLGEPHIIRTGDVESALASAPLRITGELESGGQEHFYLETHVTLAVPEENQTLRL